MQSVGMDGMMHLRTKTDNDWKQLCGEAEERSFRRSSNQVANLTKQAQDGGSTSKSSKRKQVEQLTNITKKQAAVSQQLNQQEGLNVNEEYQGGNYHQNHPARNHHHA